MSYIGKEPQYTDFLSKFFNGDGTAMTVTLDASPPNEAALLVFIDGVRQDTSAYTVSGYSLTFTGAVPSGTNNVQVVHLGIAQDTQVPVDDSVSTAKIQDDAVTSAKLDTNIAIDGDLTVDTDTLYVDSTNNKVGISNTSPNSKLTISSGSRHGHFNYANTSEDGAIPLIGSFNNADPSAATYGWGFYDSDSTGNLTLYRRSGSTTGTKTAEFNRTNGDFGFDSGYGSTATAYGCRAWVNFDGTGTVAIRDSGNVSSVTDLGAGDYRVNFTTAMPDANYAPVNSMGASGAAYHVSRSVTFLTTSYRFYTGYVNSLGGGFTKQDSPYNAFGFFR